MLPYWVALKDAVIDRSPAELIGAMMAALILSLVATGLYQLGCRKLRDGVMLMTGLVLCTCLAAMLLTVGVLAHKARTPRSQPVAARRQVLPGPPRGHLERHLARRILAAADRDGDGLLSEEEAASAAARFVHNADANGTGALDINALAHAIWTDDRPGRSGPELPPGRRSNGDRLGTRDDSNRRAERTP